MTKTMQTHTRMCFWGFGWYCYPFMESHDQKTILGHE